MNPCTTQSHQEHLPEQGEVSELEENPVIQSILGQGGAQPWLSSTTAPPAPCPVYPRQSHFLACGKMPACGGGRSFCIPPHMITTPTGGN